MTTFTAHGKTYTVDSAKARIAELEKLNAEIGASDGRVTEIDAIREAMEAAAPARPVRRVGTSAPFASAGDRTEAERSVAVLRRSEAELRTLPRNTPGDGRIDYTDLRTGRRRVATYGTRDGFLKAYIKFSKEPNRYEMHFVDEA